MMRRPWARFLKVAFLDDAALVELRDGDFTGINRYWLFRLANDLPCGQLWLDLENVHSLKSTELAMLLALQKDVSRSGGKVILFNVAPGPQGALEATRLSRLFEVR